MARIFGALANAAAKYGEGANRKQQYLDEQDRLAREEQRRVFEFAATQERLKEQAKAAAQEREQERLFRAQEAGYADAPDVAGVRAGGAALSAITGMQMGNGVGATAQEDTPYTAEVEGRKIRAQQKPSQYLTIGGKTLRRNQQSDANAAAQAEEAKALWDLKIKREIAQQNKEAEYKQRMLLQEQTAESRAALQAIINQGRPQPQPKMDLWTDGKGSYLRLGMDDPIPAGYQPVRSGGGGGATAAKIAQQEPMRAALRDIGAQVLAQGAEGQGLPAPSIMERYLSEKKSDPKSGPLTRTLAGAGYATSASPDVRRAQNFVDQVASVLLPLRGGKAITPGEKQIIMGAITVDPGEGPEMRAQKIRAFEMLLAPVLAEGGSDIEQEIAGMRERAAKYRGGKGSGMTFEEGLSRVRKP